MSKLFAIADLHLSTSGAKPMDVFGEIWNDHADRIAEAWDATVESDDAVLLPGDLSWARTLEEASGDLSWIGARPGRKILLRGNHDSWWRSISKVRGALPEGCEALQNDALRIDDGRVIVGARGWTAPDDPWGTVADEKIHRRELERLRMSVEDADRRFSRDLPRVAMVHFPPWIVDREPTDVVEILEQAGVRVCVYGHLHAEDHALGVQGVRRGIRYVLVAADAIGFAPVEISP
jgi:predicted phosphohydrolase